MRLTFFFFVLFFSPAAFAQKANNQLGLGFDFSNPVGKYAEYNPGGGVEAKGLWGVGTSTGQITVTTGFIQINAPERIFAKRRIMIIPIMVGYRHRIGKIYIEPELGGSQLQYKSSTYKSGQFKFTYAAGAGVLIKKIDLGIRYQNADGLGLVIFRLGYLFTIGS